jgi:hypothetical protein
MTKIHEINSTIGLGRLGKLEHLEINDHVHVVKYNTIPLSDGTSVYVFARSVQIPDEGIVVYFYPVIEEALSFREGRPQAVIHSSSTISPDNKQHRRVYEEIMREFQEAA